MKRLLFTITLLTIFPAIAASQTQTRQRLSSESTAQTESAAARSRVVGPRVSNHADKPKPRPEATDLSPAAKIDESASRPLSGNTLIAGAPGSPSSYTVGPGDVLDIRLSNTPARDSTLFTVLKNGSIEYPLIDGAIVVAGMTTDEIAKCLGAAIKVIKAPRVSVNVRQYASHSIVISGLVDSPGKKILRREAMPLFALLAEASVRPEATTATIVHNGKEGAPLSLKNEQAMAMLVSSGDAIKISGGNAAPSQYAYVGGDVAAPGEKTFRSGMTLTQVLLAAGASLSTSRTIVKISRRSPSGLLSTIEYDLDSIGRGQAPDPQIVPGDRIEVKRGN